MPYYALREGWKWICRYDDADGWATVGTVEEATKFLTEQDAIAFAGDKAPDRTWDLYRVSIEKVEP